MEKKKIYKWARGKDAIKLLEKEGGKNYYDFLPSQRVFYIPYEGGIIENSYDYDVKNYVTSQGIEIKPKEILDDVERKYLSNVCRPFLKDVLYIVKEANLVGHEYIRVIMHDILNCFSLPYFSNGKMYKGMKLDKHYTPKELNLR